MDASRLYTKYTARPSAVSRIPFYIEQAFRSATYGRPGAAYIDLPADTLNASADPATVLFPPAVPAPPRSLADPTSVQTAANALRSASRPLIVIGKGAAYARAEVHTRATQGPYYY